MQPGPARGQTLGQGVLRKSFLGGQIFDQLDHFETLPRRELQKRAEQAQALDGAACRHAELEMQLGGEIEVFHLAPMTSIGLRDPLKNRTSQQNLSRRTLGRGRPPGWHAELHPSDRIGCNYAKKQLLQQARLGYDASTAPNHGDSG